MFCPKCGGQMIQSEGTLYCRKGDMDLSVEMLSKLNETFVLKTRKAEEHKHLTGIDGNWFCPNHGEKMIKKAGYATCPVCGLSISEFIYQLTELHPHKKVEY